MARIKITGYMNTEDLDDDWVDLDHPSGLSETGTFELSEQLELESFAAELAP